MKLSKKHLGPNNFSSNNTLFLSVRIVVQEKHCTGFLLIFNSFVTESRAPFTFTYYSFIIHKGLKFPISLHT